MTFLIQHMSLRMSEFYILEDDEIIYQGDFAISRLTDEIPKIEEIEEFDLVNNTNIFGITVGDVFNKVINKRTFGMTVIQAKKFYDTTRFHHFFATTKPRRIFFKIGILLNEN